MASTTLSPVNNPNTNSAYAVNTPRTNTHARLDMTATKKPDDVASSATTASSSSPVDEPFESANSSTGEVNSAELKSTVASSSRGVEVWFSNDNVFTSLGWHDVMAFMKARSSPMLQCFELQASGRQ